MPGSKSLTSNNGMTPKLSVFFERELRSDHAGEIGAVSIYNGIVSVARMRGDTEMLAFAQAHRKTETEHLALVEQWLPPERQSLLLGPWRVAGWLTGALPALFGHRAMYKTIEAVETFVDQHYQQQIDHLTRFGGPEGLLPVLLRCQADEQHHRDEATAFAGDTSNFFIKTWCWLVGFGSKVAVGLARRI